MNTRIDEDIKRDGDAVFALLGLTPSAVVRAVWEYAAQHKDAPAIVANALKQPSEASVAIDASYRMQIAESASDLVSNYRERIGVPRIACNEALDYKSMREDAWADKLAERGLT